MEQIDYKFIDQVLADHACDASQIIAIMQDVQGKYRYLPKDALRYIEDKVGIIAAVCIKLAEMNVNVLDISQTILDGKFTMVMAVDAANANVGFEELAAQLRELGEGMELSIRIQREEIFDAMHRI